MVLTGKDLDALSDDPDELADRPAGAGGAVGRDRMAGQIYIDGFTGGQLPPKSSIREIRINQNPFSAEYDKLGYGRIEIFTKPGTDLYHGSVSVNGNSSYFNSTSPFATSTPAYDTTQYTANFGGPVGKKASFFINFERRNIGDNAIVNAFVLDPTTFDANAVQHVGAHTADAYQRQPAHGLPTHAEQYVERAVPVVAERPEQPRRGAVLAAHARRTTCRRPSRRYSSAIRSCSGRKVVNEIRFQYLGDRINQMPASTDTTLNVQGAFVGGGNSAGLQHRCPGPFRVPELHLACWRASTCSNSGAGCGRSAMTAYATPNFNGTFTFNSLDAYQITEQGIADRLDPGTDSRRGRRGGTVLDYLRDAVPPW